METTIFIKNGIVVQVMTPAEATILLASVHDTSAYDTITNDPSGLFVVDEVFSIESWEDKNLTADEKSVRLQAEITTAIETMLNNIAKEYRFDDIKSARAQAGYVLDGSEAVEEVSIITRAKSIAKWELNCWGTSLRIEAAVNAGTRPVPTVIEVLAEMPLYVA